MNGLTPVGPAGEEADIEAAERRVISVEQVSVHSQAVIERNIYSSEEPNRVVALKFALDSKSYFFDRTTAGSPKTICELAEAYLAYMADGTIPDKDCGLESEVDPS